MLTLTVTAIHESFCFFCIPSSGCCGISAAPRRREYDEVLVRRSECSGLKKVALVLLRWNATAWMRTLQSRKRWLSKCGANLGTWIQHVVAKMFFTNVEALGDHDDHDAWISRLLALLIRNSKDQYMVGNDQLDAIPCDVKAENISNCYKSKIYFRRWQ